MRLSIGLCPFRCQSCFELAQGRQEKVAAEITESIVRHTGTDPNYIYVIFEDVKASDWAGAGKLFGKAPAAGAA